jgi:hypothetical protein
MSFLQTDQPLYLPEGSVRAIIALGVVGAFVAGALDQLEVVALVLGFYFGQKVNS